MTGCYQWLFYGEETSMAVRFFVQGVDIFCPTRAWVHHLWEKGYRQCFDDQKKQHIAIGRTSSQQRVRAMLAQQPVPHHPTLDPTAWPVPGGGVWTLARFAQLNEGKRSVRDFESWSGVDFNANALLNAAQRGGLAIEHEVNLQQDTVRHTELWAPTGDGWEDNPPPKRVDDPLWMLGAAERGSGICVQHDAMPVALAEHCEAVLRRSSKSAWLQMDGDRQHVLSYKQQQQIAKGGVQCDAAAAAQIVSMR